MRNTSSYRHVISEMEIALHNRGNMSGFGGMEADVFHPKTDTFTERFDRTRLQLIVGQKSITIKSSGLGLCMSNPFQGYMTDPKEIPPEEFVFEATFHAKGGISMVTGGTCRHPDRRFRVFTSDQMYGIRLIVKEAEGLFRDVLGKLPNELKTIMFEHPGLSKNCLNLYMYACPYSRMVIRKDCSLPAIVIEPGLYRNPAVRVAARRNEFNNFIRAWTGNGTKPVVRAAGSMTMTQHVTRVDESMGVMLTEMGRVDMRTGTGTFTYPTVFNRRLFDILTKDLAVPLEKAAVICAKISAHDCHNLSSRWKHMVDSYHHSGESLEKYNFPALRMLYELIGKESATKHLFKGEYKDFDELAHHVPDTIRMLKEFDSPSKIKTKKGLEMFPEGLKLKRSWTSLKDLHDDMSRKYTKLKALESRKFIKWPEKLKGLHGRKADDLRILLPRMTTKIVKWGKDQNHCVAGYADRMVAGEEIIFGVYKSNKLTYVGRVSNVDVKINREGRGVPLARLGPPNEPQPYGEKVNLDYYKLSEIRSKGNGTVEPADLKKIYGILMQYGIENLYEGKF